MSLTHRFKRIVNDALSRYGYRVERIVDYGTSGLTVFELAVSSLEPMDPDFFFVQVGAHDGQRGDPIHGLVQRYHWRGLLMEPQPDVFEKLASNYRYEPQLLLENAALAGHDGSLPLYTTPGSGLRASQSREALRKHVGWSVPVIEINVRALTFRTLVKIHDIARIDLLVVDTEGYDYEVVRTVLTEGSLPRLIRYEHLHLSAEDRTACANLLVAHGYQLLRDGIDTVALRQKPE